MRREFEFEVFGYEVYAWAQIFESNMAGGRMIKLGVSWGNRL